MKTLVPHHSSAHLFINLCFVFGFGILSSPAPSLGAEVSSIFTPVPGEIRLEKVALAKSLTIEVDGKKENLLRVAAGIRKKQFGFLWPKVYIGQLFMNEGAEFKSDTVSVAFESIEKASVAAISMTFLRDVENEKISSGFKESLEKNLFFEEKDPVAKELLGMVRKSGDIKEGQTLWIGLKKNGDTNQTLLLVNGEGFLQKALVGIGASKRIFSMWLGKPADSGVKDFQDQLLAKEKKSPKKSGW